VVDVVKRTVRTVTDLPGSSLFPSWPADGRLCFRYDGDDYRGFMMADGALSVPERPLPRDVARAPASLHWADLFPGTPLPPHALNLVLVWATWSAHSPDALLDLERARTAFTARGADIGVVTAVDTGSLRADVAQTRRRYGIDLPEIPLTPQGLGRTEAINQMPTSMLFRGNVMVDRRLGAQTAEQLDEWVSRFDAVR